MQRANSTSIVGFKGALETHAASRYNFFQFHAVFGKNKFVHPLVPLPLDWLLWEIPDSPLTSEYDEIDSHALKSPFFITGTFDVLTYFKVIY